MLPRGPVFRADAQAELAALPPSGVGAAGGSPSLLSGFRVTAEADPNPYPVRRRRGGGRMPRFGVHCCRCVAVMRAAAVEGVPPAAVTLLPSLHHSQAAIEVAVLSARKNGTGVSWRGIGRTDLRSRDAVEGKGP